MNTQRIRRFFPPRQQARQNQAEGPDGMSMVELLVATVVVAVVLAGLVNLSTRQFSSTRRSSALNAIEATISQDLEWLRSYARIWKLSSGPYTLTTSQTTSSSYTQSASLTYTPDAGDCDNGTLPSAFLTAASGVTTTPPRPFAVPTSPGSTTLTLPSDASGYTLTRTITADGVQNNRIRVSYSLSGTGSNELGLQRTTSILIEASAWCP